MRFESKSKLSCPLESQSILLLFSFKVASHSISSNVNPEDPPSSFSIAHITIRGPCIVIKVAFLGGTPGNIRNEVSD